MLKLNKALILIILIIIFVQCKRQKHDEYVYTLTDEELSMLCEGDIVMRMGFGPISMLLESSAGSCGVSHCGVLVGDNPDFHVIHSISGELAEEDGVQKCTLNEFLTEAKKNSFAVVRFNHVERQEIASEAKRHLAKRTPFDMQFDINDTTKIFCSELLYRIIDDTYQLKIFEGTERIYPFNVFFNQDNFTTIINHNTKRKSKKQI